MRKKKTKKKQKQLQMRTGGVGQSTHIKLYQELYDQIAAEAAASGMSITRLIVYYLERRGVARDDLMRTFAIAK